MHEQNMAILKSLVSVAWADGVFEDKEREMLDALIEAFRATEDEAKEIRAYAAEKKTLDDIPLTDLSADDRYTLLQHAVLLTFIDGTQHEAEKKFIDDLCKKLRIPEKDARDLISAAEDRAKRYLELLKLPSELRA
jgi:uncharacterized tellurite resistance protein B-like protein